MFDVHVCLISKYVVALLDMLDIHIFTLSTIVEETKNLCIFDVDSPHLYCQYTLCLFLARCVNCEH